MLQLLVFGSGCWGLQADAGTWWGYMWVFWVMLSKKLLFSNLNIKNFFNTHCTDTAFPAALPPSLFFPTSRWLTLQCVCIIVCASEWSVSLCSHMQPDQDPVFSAFQNSFVNSKYSELYFCMCRIMQICIKASPKTQISVAQRSSQFASWFWAHFYGECSRLL